jgi:hypothetical protein
MEIGRLYLERIVYNEPEHRVALLHPLVLSVSTKHSQNHNSLHPREDVTRCQLSLPV